MHPLGLCNNNDEEDLYEYGWVGVVKLEQPELDPSCLTVLGKVQENHFPNLAHFLCYFVSVSHRKLDILLNRACGLNPPPPLTASRAPSFPTLLQLSQTPLESVNGILSCFN